MGVVGDEVFLAMELIRGQTLTAWLGAERRGWREIVRIFVDAARGLAAAHEVGLVHRDFKPDNVLISEDGRVRVADFGLAREEHGGDAAWNPGTRGLLVDTLTATGVLMGTPMYMSPEQCRADPIGPPTDIYAVGAMLYEMVTQHPPFEGPTMAMLAMHLFQPVVPPSQRVADKYIPRALEELILAMLEKRPEDRPSADGVAQAMRQLSVTLGERERAFEFLHGAGEPRELEGPAGRLLRERLVRAREGLGRR